jgi:hypothetical protein
VKVGDAPDCLVPLLQLIPVPSDGRLLIDRHVTPPTERGPFDAIIVADLPPTASQSSFLRSRRGLLAPGGILCVGAANRVGWNRLRRRELTRDATLRTHRGYMRLFMDAGYIVHSTHVSPGGAGDTAELVPLERRAVAHYAQMRTLRLRWLTGTEWFWRRFGVYFFFTMQPRSAARNA